MCYLGSGADECVDEDLRPQDGVWDSIFGRNLEVSGEGIQLNILRTRAIGEVEVEPGEEERSSCLSGIKSLGCL